MKLKIDRAVTPPCAQNPALNGRFKRLIPTLLVAAPDAQAGISGIPDASRKRRTFFATWFSAALFGLSAASSASALTVTYNFSGTAQSDAALNNTLNGANSNSYGTAPGSATNQTISNFGGYQQLLTLPQWNPALFANYYLTGATYAYGGAFSTEGVIENLDVTPVDLTAGSTVTQRFYADGSNGSTALTFTGYPVNGGFGNQRGRIELGGTLFNGSLGANDGLDDGGLDWTGPVSTEDAQWWFQKTVDLTNSANRIALQGAGNFNTYVDVATGLSLAGTLNVDASLVTSAESKVQVTYTYAYDPTLTPGSVDYLIASPSQVGYSAGTRTAPTSSTPSQITLKGLDILAGSSFDLGTYETLNLDDGNGLLHVGQGGQFIGNGIIQGNVLNEGRVVIPLTAMPQVTGGYVIPTPPRPGGPTGPSDGTVNTGTRVDFGAAPSGSATFGGSGGTAGGTGGGGVGGTPVEPGPVQEIDPCGTQVGGCGITVQGAPVVDGSLEVTGYYEQTETGSTLMFVAGNHSADFDVSKTGGTYSQLFVHDFINLDGAVQIALMPDRFNGYYDGHNYTPHVGDTFDFFISDTSITWQPGLRFETFVTVEGAGLLDWLTTSAYDSGIANDPYHLLRVSNHLFDFNVVQENGQYILRGTLVAWGADSGSGSGSGSVPEPSGLWLMIAGLLGFARFNRRVKNFAQ